MIFRRRKIDELRSEHILVDVDRCDQEAIPEGGGRNFIQKKGFSTPPQLGAKQQMRARLRSAETTFPQYLKRQYQPRVGTPNSVPWKV